MDEGSANILFVRLSSSDNLCLQCATREIDVTGTSVSSSVSLLLLLVTMEAAAPFEPPAPAPPLAVAPSIAIAELLLLDEDEAEEDVGTETGATGISSTEYRPSVVLTSKDALIKCP
jgi:hypothetical protein